MMIALMLTGSLTLPQRAAADPVASNRLREARTGGSEPERAEHCQLPQVDRSGLRPAATQGDGSSLSRSTRAPRATRGSRVRTAVRDATPPVKPLHHKLWPGPDDAVDGEEGARVLAIDRKRRSLGW